MDMYDSTLRLKYNIVPTRLGPPSSSSHDRKSRASNVNVIQNIILTPTHLTRLLSLGSTSPCHAYHLDVVLADIALVFYTSTL